MPDLAGAMLGKYQVLERLGKGGMAAVYKAYQPGLDRHVAVKALHPHLADAPDFVGRFRREAQAVANLRHPNIVQVFDFDYDETADTYYMVMEFIDGVTLRARLVELNGAGRRMPPAEAIGFFEDLLAGVGYAHAHGMVHRDLKPANIMFDRQGRPVLTDFGIAKIVGGARFTLTGEVVGTPVYMSPEQSQGAPGDERSDIYSLGVVLFETLTGQVPYDADTPLAIMLKHMNEPTPSLRSISPDFPEALEQIAFRALAKYPAYRYQSAAEMWAALSQLRALGVTDAHAPGQSPPAPTPPDESAATPLVSPHNAVVPLLDPGVGGFPSGASASGAPRVEKSGIEATARVLPRRYPWLASTALVLALVAGWLYYANFSPAALHARVEQGQTQLAAEEYRFALQTFDGVLARRPNYVPALLGRAAALVGLGQPDVALKEVELAVSIAPDDPEVHLARGRYTLLYTSGPDLAVALRDFDHAIELDPAAAGGYLARGWAILNFRRDAAGALPDLRAAVRLRPDDPEGHGTLAQALYLASDNDAALAEIQAAIHIKSDKAAYFIQSALIRYALSDPISAVKDMDAAIALEPRQANYYAMRAYLYYERSEYSRALGDVDESFRLMPDNPAALYVHGLSNYKLAKYDLSLADLDEVLKHEPFEYSWPFLRIENVHEINLDRALVLQEMPGRAAEARAAYDKSAAAHPDWFAIYYYRGVYLARQDESQDARADLLRALTFAPDEDWRKLARAQLEALE